MKTITLVVKISNVEGWDIDWNDKEKRESELKQLCRDVEYAISGECGISMINVDAEIKETEL